MQTVRLPHAARGREAAEPSRSAWLSPRTLPSLMWVEARMPRHFQGSQNVLLLPPVI